MGQTFTKYLAPHLWREDEPDCAAPIKYHDEFGFEKPRSAKAVTVSEEEMDSANIPEKFRDFCVYYRIHYYGCLRDNAPCSWRCEGFKNELKHCYELEFIDDMKEFEREKRLNARERRITERSK